MHIDLTPTHSPKDLLLLSLRAAALLVSLLPLLAELAHPEASLHGMKNFLPSPSPFFAAAAATTTELAAHLAKKRTNKVQLRGWLIARATNAPS